MPTTSPSRAPGGYEGKFSADCKGTIALGQEKTCTVENSDGPATLTLIKEVVNDNGGKAGPDDFGLSIGGDPVDSGETKTLSAGSYAIDEEGLAGYAFVKITGDEACPSSLGGEVELGLGDDVECTIVNDDIPAKLTVIKKVTNEHGLHRAAPGDFTMLINGVTAAGGKTALRAQRPASPRRSRLSAPTT